jgi:hypothetical protein
MQVLSNRLYNERIENVILVLHRYLAYQLQLLMCLLRLFTH